MSDKLVGTLDVVADASGGPEGFRRLVLALALRGRLSSQKPGDGDAQDALERAKVDRSWRVEERSAEPRLDPKIEALVGVSPVPRGWQECRLDNCAQLINGRAYSQHELLPAGTPVIRIQNLNGGMDWYYSNLTLPARQYCDQGDLLFAWSASFGPYIWNGSKAIYHYHIWKLSLSPAIDKRFLYYSLRHITDVVREQSHGLAMLHMTKSQMERWPILLPPLAEQKRIVAKVDQLMALCDDLEAKQTKKRALATQSTRSALTALATAESPAELSVSWRRVSANFPSLVPTTDSVVDLRGFVLSLAAQGKLTGRKRPLHDGGRFLKQIRERCLAEAKTRGIRSQDASPICARDEPAPLPEGWNWARLGDLCFQITDGTHYTPTYVPAGMPFLSVKDVTGGKVDFSDAKYITKEEHSKLTARCRPERNDVLLTKVGTTGVARVVDTDREFSIFVSLALLKFPHDLVLPDYLCLFLNSPLARAQSERDTQGIGNKNLVLKFIREFLVPLPPRAEQVEIVRAVGKLMSLLDDLESKLRKQEETATRLAEALASTVAA